MVNQFLVLAQEVYQEIDMIVLFYIAEFLIASF